MEDPFNDNNFEVTLQTYVKSQTYTQETSIKVRVGHKNPCLYRKLSSFSTLSSNLLYAHRTALFQGLVHHPAFDKILKEITH